MRVWIRLLGRRFARAGRDDPDAMPLRPLPPTRGTRIPAKPAPTAGTRALEAPRETAGTRGYRQPAGTPSTQRLHNPRRPGR